MITDSLLLEIRSLVELFAIEDLYRAEVYEARIKAQDRALSLVRHAIHAAPALEEKLSLMRTQRELERERSALKKQLYVVTDSENNFSPLYSIAKSEVKMLLEPIQKLLAAADINCEEEQ